ncbi:RluA family pseudouridine synthase [Bdellovibrio sp. HCB2-146]|uniref:RluA family pseudouridine synthase n=1 Tax=Bdellovibrio sp. HCB2-146 TaxID=3394362 RepID=UPI0039BD2240
MQSARGFEYGVRHIISPQSGLLCDVLLGILDIDRTQIEFLLQLGCIYVKGQREIQNIFIEKEDYLRVHTKPRRFLADDGLWKTRIVFQNSDFVVVKKISGLPVHASVDNLKENVQAYVEKAIGQKVLLTHRLDVPTRGLIVYAKTEQFQSAFNKLLIERGMNKIYRALVHGEKIPLGLVTHYMEPSPRAPKTVSTEAKTDWQECQLEVLNYRLWEPGISEVRIKLITGRTHQIRAQMSALGYPIVGDVSYGAARQWLEDRIELEAAELSFTNPLSGEIHHFRADEDNYLID